MVGRDAIGWAGGGCSSDGRLLGEGGLVRYRNLATATTSVWIEMNNLKNSITDPS